MTYVIDFEKEYDLSIIPKSEADARVQELYVLINTTLAEAPLYREFGLDKNFISMPVNVAQTMITAAVADAVRDFMPGVRIDSIEFTVHADTPEHMISRIEVVDDEQA